MNVERVAKKFAIFDFFFFGDLYFFCMLKKNTFLKTLQKPLKKFPETRKLQIFLLLSLHSMSKCSIKNLS